MIALIVVNYKKSDLTVRLAESLVQQTARGLVRLMVVDNASDDASRDGLAPLARMPIQIDLLEERENWGYFGGARRALTRLRAEGPLPEWIVVLNSDIDIPDPAFIQKLYDYQTACGVGVLAPSIRTSKFCANQNPHLISRPSRRRMQFYKWVFRWRASSIAYRAMGQVKARIRNVCRRAIAMNEPTAREIYAAHGSCLIFSSQFFERGGSLDHPPFLFGEEITIAETCRKVGLGVRYEPNFEVSHARHSTLRWIPPRMQHMYLRQASAYCADTFFG